MIRLQTQAVVTDIEGTTTDIAFVHDILFPYARRALPEFVRQQAGQPEVAVQLQAAAELAACKPDELDVLIDALIRWIDEDRKATPLKALQGMIWRAGYQRGDFRGHVYADAHQQLQAWHRAGVRLHVYSSGSIAAQQLLFGHSDFGDLRPLFSGWFDTTSGAKTSPDSYRRIATSIRQQAAAENILFLSDVVGELDAARDSGLQTLQLCRQSGMQTGSHAIIEDFLELELQP